MNLANTNMQPAKIDELAQYVRTIPDFPKPGINFKDIMPLLAQPAAFQELIERMSFEVKQSDANVVVGLESRGFIFGVAIAQNLGLPFVPARKAGKLPGETVSVSYALEYGGQAMELQRDAVKPGDKVAIVDDLLATGGTVRAAAELTKQLGGDVAGYFFAIELDFLNGRETLGEAKVASVMHM